MLSGLYGGSFLASCSCGLLYRTVRTAPYRAALLEPSARLRSRSGHFRMGVAASCCDRIISTPLRALRHGEDIIWLSVSGCSVRTH
eukprot:895074-Prorocentrum_minimum.AAC.2